MIRYYLDSNIFRIIKPKHPYYNDDLRHFLDELKDKVLFCFSDAHLDDLKNSIKEYRDKDLQLMCEYVKDNYFNRDPIKKITAPLLANPYDAFYSKDYEAGDNFLKSPFDIDSLFSELEDSPEIGVIKNTLKSLFNMPLSALGETIDMDNMDDLTKNWMDKILPGYSPSMSLLEFTNSMLPYGNELLQNDKELSKLRKLMSSYFKTDEYSFEKWGMDFNDKFKESTLGKTFLDTIDGMLLENQKSDFHLRFSYAYAQLEIYNITQERNKRGLKKFNYQSLTNDSNHAYFASWSDYLITDDKGLQVKAHILYKLFNIPTIVLSSSDFLNHRNLILSREEEVVPFANALKYDLNHAMQIFNKVDIIDGGVTETYKTNHIYFNYFNRLQISKGEGLAYGLYCERNGVGNNYMFREIELLVNKTIRLFGIDDENKGVFDFDEREQLPNIVRIWTRGDLVYEIQLSHRTRGSFICLAFYFKSSSIANS